MSYRHLVASACVLCLGCVERDTRCWTNGISLLDGSGLGNGSVEHITRPAQAKLGDGGDIYISDLGRMQILHFDNAGRLQDTIGRRGRAPGQFMQITSFNVASDGRVVVFDTPLARVTVFDGEGEVESVYESSHEDMLWPRQVLGMELDSLILLYKLPETDAKGRPRPNADFLFHEFGVRDGRFERLGDFGNVMIAGDIRRFAVDAFTQGHPGSVTFVNQELWYAPELFSGTLLAFRFNGEGWNQREWTAWTDEVEPYVLLRSTPTDSVARLDAITFNAPRREKAGLVVNRESLGLFPFADNKVLHFMLERRKGRSPIFSVDVDTEAGSYEYSVDLSAQLEIPYEHYGLSPLSVLAMSSEGRLYTFMGATAGVRVLNVVESKLEAPEVQRDCG